MHPVAPKRCVAYYTPLAVIVSFLIGSFLFPHSYSYTRDDGSYSYTRDWGPHAREFRVSESKIKHVCDTKEQQANARHVYNIGLNWCEEADWVSEWRKNVSQVNFTCVQIGCNKADDAVDMLRLFTKNEAVTQAKWKKQLVDFHEKWSSCTNGADSELARDLPEIGSYEHHCIEPMSDNFIGTSKAAKALGWDALGLKLSQYAVTSLARPSTVKFPRGKFQGAEAFGIDNDGLSLHKGSWFTSDSEVSYENIQTITVDDFIQQNGILDRGGLDVLIIDTEENDPRVLIGATKTLLLLKPSYVVFEYSYNNQHHRTAWFRFLLQDVVDLLDSMEYECYILGKKMLWRITACMDPSYEGSYMNTNMVRNVGCHHRENKILGDIMWRKYQQTRSLQKKSRRSHKS